MRVQELFIATERSLTAVIEQIRDEQWDMRLPASFARRGSNAPPPTLREIVNYHASDDAWVPDTLAGKTIEQVGDAHAGELLGAEPLSNWRAIVAKSVAAVEAVGDGELERPVHLSYGDWPVREYLTHTISFRGLRTVDIARAIGADDTLPDGLAQALWDALSPDAEQWREIGVYGPAIEVPADADVQARLMGLTGREP